MGFVKGWVALGILGSEGFQMLGREYRLFETCELDARYVLSFMLKCNLAARRTFSCSQATNRQKLYG